MREKIYLDIDVSSAKETIAALRKVYTEAELRRMVYSAFKRTAQYTRTAVKRILPQEYHVTQKVVGKHIGQPVIKMGGIGLGVSCVIPIKGKRLSIGGSFKARGGMPGWSAVRAGKRYKITAKIVRDGNSTMPGTMEHQGGYPPFINTVAPKLHNAAFTRTGRKTKNGKDAIAKVVGIAVPQMPMNRSKEEVEDAVAKKLIERLEHEHAWRVQQCQR